MPTPAPSYPSTVSLVSPQQWHEELTQVCQLQSPSTKFYVCLFFFYVCLPSLCLLSPKKCEEGPPAPAHHKDSSVLDEVPIIMWSWKFPEALSFEWPKWCYFLSEAVSMFSPGLIFFFFFLNQSLKSTCFGLCLSKSVIPTHWPSSPSPCPYSVF